MSQPVALEMWVLAFVLVLVRVSVFIALMPFLEDRNIPRPVKLGLALALTFTWFSANTTAEGAHDAVSALNGHWLAYMIAIIREAILGAALGYAFGLLVLPARIAGNYIGQEMGLTMASIASPGAAGSTNVVGALFEALAALLFFVMDIHHVMIGMLHVSFQKWQIGAVLPTGATAWMSMQLAQTHQWGMQIAAPVAVCMLANLILMVIIMKAAPQLNLFSVGFTLRLLIGMLATLAFLPEMIAMTGQLFSGASEFVAFF